jgi:membrane protein YqaA with SNARE-associated domain
MFFITLSLLTISKAYKYALFGTLGTLFGAIAGFSIGHFAWFNVNGNFTGFAQFLFDYVPGFSEVIYNKIHVLYAKWDWGILLIAPFIPVPYKIFSISSGIFDINVFIFCIATLIGQGIRFYLLAFLIIKIGTAVKKVLKFKLKPVAIIVTVCIALGIVVIKIF